MIMEFQDFALIGHDWPGYPSSINSRVLIHLSQNSRARAGMEFEVDQQRPSTLPSFPKGSTEVGCCRCCSFGNPKVSESAEAAL